ncbi:hypothetical protein C8R43DRAFT_1035585 [Mycena crocata]|nr:hypothetical protein C8R43DRAFT_1035585 [Mycena crocata]
MRVDRGGGGRGTGIRGARSCLLGRGGSRSEAGWCVRGQSAQRPGPGPIMCEQVIGSAWTLAGGTGRGDQTESCRCAEKEQSRARTPGETRPGERVQAERSSLGYTPRHQHYPDAPRRKKEHYVCVINDAYTPSTPRAHRCREDPNVQRLTLDRTPLERRIPSTAMRFTLQLALCPHRRDENGYGFRRRPTTFLHDQRSVAKTDDVPQGDVPSRPQPTFTVTYDSLTLTSWLSIRSTFYLG